MAERNLRQIEAEASSNLVARSKIGQSYRKDGPSDSTSGEPPEQQKAWERWLQVSNTHPAQGSRIRQVLGICKEVPENLEKHRIEFLKSRQGRAGGGPVTNPPFSLSTKYG